MEYSEDHIALAAEYALGTLEAEERTQVEALMAVDTDYAAVVQAWEFRLGVLNQMVGSVEPPPGLWDKISKAVGLTGLPQAPLVVPEPPPGAPPPALEDQIGEAVASLQAPAPPPPPPSPPSAAPAPPMAAP